MAPNVLGQVITILVSDRLFYAVFVGVGDGDALEFDLEHYTGLRSHWVNTGIDELEELVHQVVPVWVVVGAFAVCAATIGDGFSWIPPRFVFKNRGFNTVLVTKGAVGVLGDHVGEKEATDRGSFFKRHRLIVRPVDAAIGLTLWTDCTEALSAWVPQIAAQF